MKRFLQASALILILITSYVAAGPYITVSSIKTGVINHDSVKLSENIDFEALRQNLKDQFNLAMLKNATEVDNNPFALLAAGLVTTMMDKMVDSIITPGGMASIMQGNTIEEINQDKTGDASNKEKIFENARYSYDSVNNFSVWVPMENNKETRLVLKRDIFTWKLVNIIIPSIDNN